MEIGHCASLAHFVSKATTTAVHARTAVLRTEVYESPLVETSSTLGVRFHYEQAFTSRDELRLVSMFQSLC